MKDIKGYEGLYAVTEDGQVWSYKSNRFLSVVRSGNGYYYVGLTKDKKKRDIKISRIVAETYIPNPNPEEYNQVGHKDEDTSNNCVANLYWTNAKENCNYGTHNKRLSKALAKAVYCVELDKVFESQKEAAAEIGICSASISRCCNGKRKTAGGYHWRFATEFEITAHKLKTSLDELAKAVKMDLHLERIGEACNSLLESAC